MNQSAAAAPPLSEIFLSFLRIGLTSFGGPAIVPYMRALAVERRRWVDPEGFDRANAIAQVVPGAISVQVAAYVGLRLRGLPPVPADMLSLRSWWSRHLYHRRTALSVPLVSAYRGVRGAVRAIRGRRSGG